MSLRDDYAALQRSASALKGASVATAQDPELQDALPPILKESSEATTINRLLSTAWGRGAKNRDGTPSELEAAHTLLHQTAKGIASGKYDRNHRGALHSLAMSVVELAYYAGSNSAQ